MQNIVQMFMRELNSLNYVTHALGWTNEQILDANVHGYHGSAFHGSAPWDDYLEILNKELLNIFKQMLIAEGIPLNEKI